MKLLDGVTDVMDVNLGKLRKIVGDREDWHAPIHGVMTWWLNTPGPGLCTLYSLCLELSAPDSLVGVTSLVFSWLLDIICSTSTTFSDQPTPKIIC